jgi:hypothetical protein
LSEKREKKKKKKKISSFFFANVAPLLFYFSAPGNDLLRECSLKKNDASLWDSQVRSMKSKKRSVAVEEHFGGDEEAMDSFLNQFYVDEHGRKRAVRMNRYSKKTVNGVVVEELQNWNEPKEASSGPKVVPALSVDGQNFDSLAGTPSKIGRVTGLTVVDCGLAQSTSKCTNVPTSGKWACLIERGEVTFAEKVATCVAQGASGLIMFNKVVLKEDGTEDDPEFSASLGDERAPLPVLCVKRSIGLKIKTTLLGKAATMEVPPEQASTAFLPLTNAVDQGQCGSCYLFASMAAIKMWANLLIWEEVEARGETFGPQHQMWLDTNTMAHCYQAMLRDAPSKDQAVLFVYFNGATPDGTDAQLEEKMVSILQSFAISTTDKTLPLRSAVSSFSVRSVEKDCGAGCLQVTVSISLYDAIVRAQPQMKKDGVLSTGFVGMSGKTSFTVSRVEGIPNAIVCGGGWHHKVIQEWYLEQQASRVSGAASSVRFVVHDQTNSAQVTAEKLSKGPSQRNMDANKCTKLADSKVSPQVPILYRFDPFFEEDELQLNKPPREFGPLSPYRPIYMDQSSGPGSVAFADKVRSLMNAMQHGPVMVGIAVCSSMFGVSSSNSKTNPYYDKDCKERINHIVIATAFHIEDLPEVGAAGRTSKWWERSVFAFQNSWGDDFGTHGLFWARVDFTQNWSLGIVPLVHRPGKFSNPFLPTQRLEELRMPNTRWARSTESVTDLSLPVIELGRLMQINRPALPEVAVSEVVVTLLAIDSSASPVKPKFNVAKATFGIQFSDAKYFANEDAVLAKANVDALKPAVGADLCAVAEASRVACAAATNATAEACATVNCCWNEAGSSCYKQADKPAEKTTTIKKDGKWVYWINSNTGNWTWTTTDITSRSTRDAVKMYQVVVRIQLAATSELRTKPATFWSSLALGIDFDASPNVQVAMRDFYMVVDQALSSEFRKDVESPTAEVGASSTVAVGTAAAAITAASLLI